MIVWWMLRAVCLLYIKFCTVLCTAVALYICIFCFQGCPLKDVIRELLTELETYLQFKGTRIPATLSGKLNHFEENYGRYMKTANDYCRLLGHCKKLNTLKNWKKLEAELKKYGGREWLNNELERMLVAIEKIEENQKKISSISEELTR